MKKLFKVTIDESINNFEKIYFSGGKVGLQISTSRSNFLELVKPIVSDITL